MQINFKKNFFKPTLFFLKKTPKQIIGANIFLEKNFTNDSNKKSDLIKVLSKSTKSISELK